MSIDSVSKVTFYSSEQFTPSNSIFKDICVDLAIMVSSVGLAALAGYAFAILTANPIGAAIAIALTISVVVGVVGCLAYHCLNVSPVTELDQNVPLVTKIDQNIPPIAMSEELAEVIERTPKFNGYKLSISKDFHACKELENLVMTGMSIRPSNLFFRAIGIGETTMPGKGELFAFRDDHDEIADLIYERSQTLEVIGFSAKNEFGSAAIDQKTTFPVSLEDVYGNNEYRISYKEIQKILDSQKIYVSSLLPMQFYMGLKEAMNNDGVIELRYIREGSKITKERPAHLCDWKSEKSIIAFLDEVRSSPKEYGFPNANDFDELMKLTIYQIGAMVVNSEDFHIFVDGNGKILERDVGTEDSVRLLNSCGIRPEKEVTDSTRNKIIMTETFKTALAAAESGIVLFPAVGMGVWGGDPNVYWTAFLDAVVASELSFEAIFINPNHRPYKQNKKIAGQEFEAYLQKYIAKYSNGTFANDTKLQKLLRIQNLQKKETDLVQLARELKLAFPETIISLFNASDPDVTLGNHVGEYTNNMPHTTTTEENYTAIGSNGLCFKSITHVHDFPERLIHVDYSYRVMNDATISQPVKDLFKFLFVDLIRSNNIEEVQPLGSQLEFIKERLKNMHLGCRGSQHSDDINDPWQTIKITDPTIYEIGKVSELLKELNDVLFEKFGIISNGGDEGVQGVVRGKQKRTPQCFINSKNEIMNPQLLISLMDIKRILGMIDEKAYFKALKNPMPNVI
ncbi:MAG: hypothetical protein H0T62_00585 [Parachlamydiaceae bacterium]|nr:hypothetical protein [Parachlamydiaceae bacterium]